MAELAGETPPAFGAAAARYELAVLPCLLLGASLVRPDGALRGLFLEPGGRKRALYALFGTVALCGVWFYFIVGQNPYIGPSASEFLRSRSWQNALMEAKGFFISWAIDDDRVPSAESLSAR